MAPSVDVVKIENEGVLCSSPGTEGVGEDVGNGGFGPAY